MATISFLDLNQTGLTLTITQVLQFLQATYADKYDLTNNQCLALIINGQTWIFPSFSSAGQWLLKRINPAISRINLEENRIKMFNRQKLQYYICLADARRAKYLYQTWHNQVIVDNTAIDHQIVNLDLKSKLSWLENYYAEANHLEAIKVMALVIRAKYHIFPNNTSGLSFLLKLTKLKKSIHVFLDDNVIDLTCPNNRQAIYFSNQNKAQALYQLYQEQMAKIKVNRNFLVK